MQERFTNPVITYQKEQPAKPLSCRGIRCALPECRSSNKNGRMDSLRLELYQAVLFVCNPAISFKPKDLSMPFWTIADNASCLTELGAEIHLPGVMVFNQHTFPLNDEADPEIWNFWYGSCLNVKSLKVRLYMPRLITSYPPDKPPWKIYHLDRSLTALETRQLKLR